MGTNRTDDRRAVVTDSTRQHAVHQDRVRVLARTRPADVRVQPVDTGCWRVVDASASWDDPEMLLGFVERTGAGFECTLMVQLREPTRVDTLGDAGAFFRMLCGGSGR